MTSAQLTETREFFLQSCGLRALEKAMDILNILERKLLGAWEACVNSAMPAKVAVEDEIAKAVQQHMSVFPGLM